MSCKTEPSAEIAVIGNEGTIGEEIDGPLATRAAAA
jgi:hypothetical protein